MRQILRAGSVLPSTESLIPGYHDKIAAMHLHEFPGQREPVPRMALRITRHPVLRSKLYGVAVRQAGMILRPGDGALLL